MREFTTHTQTYTKWHIVSVSIYFINFNSFSISTKNKAKKENHVSQRIFHMANKPNKSVRQSAPRKKTTGTVKSKPERKKAIKMRNEIYFEWEIKLVFHLSCEIFAFFTMSKALQHVFTKVAWWKLLFSHSLIFLHLLSMLEWQHS